MTATSESAIISQAHSREASGAMGIENELSAKDISAADVAIFAVDIEVERRERFDHKKIVQVTVKEAIRDPKAVLAKAGA